MELTLIILIISPSLTGNPDGSLRFTNCRSLWKCLYGATTSRISNNLRI